MYNAAASRYKISIGKSWRLVDFSTERAKDVPGWRDADKPYLAYPKRGMLSSAEKHLLYEMPRELGPGNYANLGTFKGLSAACLAYGLVDHGRKGKVYAVDTFKKGRKNGDFDGKLRKIFHKKGLGRYLVVCKGYTHEWAEILKDVRFRFVFIDACHKYFWVKEDFELWSPLVEEDGLIAFHDVNVHDVHKVIEEEVKQDWEEVRQVFITRVFRRKK